MRVQTRVMWAVVLSAAVLMVPFDQPTTAQAVSPRLIIHEAMQLQHGWWDGSSLNQILIPEPREGFVLVPLIANVQADNAYITRQTVHAVLRRTANAPASDLSYSLSSPFAILWVRKLTQEVLLGGEYFLPVDALPIPRGFDVYVEWADANAGGVYRTRFVGLEVPADTFDWSKVQPVSGNFRFNVSQ